MNIADQILLRAAGYAQKKAGTSDFQFGPPFGRAPYGDDPSDQALIKQGIEYSKNCRKP